MAHTPGPWSAQRNFRGFGTSWNGAKIVSVDCDNYVIARMSPKADRNIDEKRANAYLIAAAPEMYETLKLALPLHEDSGYMHTAELIRSVLAKAEGRNA